FTKNLDFLAGGGHIAFPQGTGKIAFMSFDLVSQRSLGVGRLQWRAYLPKGSNYWWHLNSGTIPAVDVLGGGAFIQGTIPRTQGIEVVITVSIRKDPVPKNKRWLFNLTYHPVDGGEKNGICTAIPDQIMDQILQAEVKIDECFGQRKAETRKRGESIILLKRRIGEQNSDNSWQSSFKPQPGFVVWLEEEK
ncbi:MAG: hypothetical protein WBL72_21890, partial [Thermoguttaceae bacterium]